MKSIKTVLHSHPHFWGPRGYRKVRPSEWVYGLIKKVPTLRDITEFSLKNSQGIVAISGAQCEPFSRDRSAEFYFEGIKDMDKNFYIDSHLDEGWVGVARKKPKKSELSHVILLSGCEVRTDYNGNAADINIIGIHPQIYIKPNRDIDETAKMGKNLGALVSVCHPNSALASCGIKKAIEMYETRKVHSIESYNAGVDLTTNEELQKELSVAGIKGIAVPDSHHYAQNISAYTLVENELYENFSRERLINEIVDGNFDNKTGQTNRFSIFMTHDLPILMSLPEHFISHPDYILKFLKPSGK